MDLVAYEMEAEVEENHWWFTTRRILFAREIAKLGLPHDAAILDVGTSTGTNLRLLRDEGFHNVAGLDFSRDAISFCQSKGFDSVKQGDVCAMPFEDNSFDLVLATDIIEHVDDDAQAVREIARVLRPGGRAIVTVPAFPSLWGLQDEVAQHKRRYRQAQFVNTLEAGGLAANDSYYFNYLLFVPIFIARKLIKAFDIKLKTESELNNAFLNRILEAVFRFDVWTAPVLRVPFGVSIMAVTTAGGADEDQD